MVKVLPMSGPDIAFRATRPTGLAPKRSQRGTCVYEDERYATKNGRWAGKREEVLIDLVASLL
eukprot:1658481-Rhodomonas_salina.1